MGRRRAFTDEEIATLERLYAEGVARPAIAGRMERPQGTVDGWITRLNLAHKYPRPRSRPQREAAHRDVPAPKKPRAPPALPVAKSDFIKSPTREQLMAGR